MDHLAHKRKQLLYKATHRGTKENDILLGRFAERELALMDGEALHIFEVFLDLPDQRIFSWCLGQEEPDPLYKYLVDKIKNR